MIANCRNRSLPANQDFKKSDTVFQENYIQFLVIAVCRNRPLSAHQDLKKSYTGFQENYTVSRDRNLQKLAVLCNQRSHVQRVEYNFSRLQIAKISCETSVCMGWKHYLHLLVLRRIFLETSFDEGLKSKSKSPSDDNGMITERNPLLVGLPFIRYRHENRYNL